MSFSETKVHNENKIIPVSMKFFMTIF